LNSRFTFHSFNGIFFWAWWPTATRSALPYACTCSLRRLINDIISSQAGEMFLSIARKKTEDDENPTIIHDLTNTLKGCSRIFTVRLKLPAKEKPFIFPSVYLGSVNFSLGAMFDLFTSALFQVLRVTSSNLCNLFKYKQRC